MTNTDNWDNISGFDEETWQTELVISEMGIPIYSAIGVTQTLKPVQESGNTQRDVQGDLDDLSDENFRKFETTISCSDVHRAPAFDGFWPGMEVTIDCIIELCYGSGGSASRDAVAGSEWSDDNDSGFHYYRPQLTCRITDYEITRDEWNQVVSWTLQAVEI